MTVRASYLTLSPATIARMGAELDEIYPGVHLYEAKPAGEQPVFLRVLGEAVAP